MFDSTHVTNFIERPPPNGGDLLLSGTTMSVSWDFYEPIFNGKEF